VLGPGRGEVFWGEDRWCTIMSAHNMTGITHCLPGQEPLFASLAQLSGVTVDQMAQLQACGICAHVTRL
jgi:hypothetical protein